MWQAIYYLTAAYSICFYVFVMLFGAHWSRYIVHKGSYGHWNETFCYVLWYAPFGLFWLCVVIQICYWIRILK